MLGLLDFTWRDVVLWPCGFGGMVSLFCALASVFCGNVSCLPGGQSRCRHSWLRSALCNCWPWYLAWSSPAVLLDWLGITSHTMVPSEFLPCSLYGHWPSEWIMNRLTLHRIGEGFATVARWQTHWVSVHVLSPSYPWDQHFWVPSIPPKCRSQVWGPGFKLPSLSKYAGLPYFSLTWHPATSLVWVWPERQPSFGTLTGSRARPHLCPQHYPQLAYEPSFFLLSLQPQSEAIRICHPASLVSFL